MPIKLRQLARNTFHAYIDDVMGDENGAAMSDGRQGMAEAGAFYSASTVHSRLGERLGINQLRSDEDLLKAVEVRLPSNAITALVSQGSVTEAEIYDLVIPRRTLAHRRMKDEPLSRDESDRLVRLARITALADDIFADPEKAARWLRKPKERFDARTPLEMLATETGGRLVEQMLHQVDHGMFA